MAKKYVYEHLVTERDATTSGITYDGSYIEWACTARERMIAEYLDARGITSPWYLIGETYIRYLSPVFIKDRMEICVTVDDHNVEKGYAKLGFRFNKKPNNQLVAQGYQVIFFYDTRTGKRVPVPKTFLTLAED